MPSSTSDSEERAAKCNLGALALVFLAINVAALAVWLLLPPSQVSKERYLATINDHIAMLRTTKGEPGRIVILGGSGVAFSISAEALSKKLDRPVYNGGIQASIGLRNMTDTYLPHLDPANDLIVIVPELELINGDRLFSRTYCDALFLMERADLLAGRPRCIPAVIHRTWQEARNFLNDSKVSDPVYQRSGFNSRGDMVAHLSVEKPVPDLSDYEIPLLREERFRTVERYIDETLTGQGFDVIVLPAALPDSACRRDGADVRASFARISSMNRGRLPPQDIRKYCLAEQLFYDGPGHLNGRGRALQTENVREQLALYLAR